MKRPPAHRGGTIWILLAAASGPWLLPASAGACSCIAPPPPEPAFHSADAVFLATVTEVREPAEYPGWIYSLLEEIDRRFSTDYLWDAYGREVAVEVAVDAAWKGVTATRAAILTGRGGGDCGYRFVVGQQYLVYAYLHEDSLNTSICSRTAAALEADDDLAFLVDLDQLPRAEVTPAPRLLLVGSLLIVAGSVALSLRLMARPHVAEK